MIMTSTGKHVRLGDLITRVLDTPGLESVLKKIYIIDLEDIRRGSKRFRRLSGLRKFEVGGFEIMYDLILDEEGSSPVSSFSYFSGDMPTFHIKCMGLDTKVGVLRVYTS